MTCDKKSSTVVLRTGLLTHQIKREKNHAIYLFGMMVCIYQELSAVLYMAFISVALWVIICDENNTLANEKCTYIFGLFLNISS